MSLQIERRDSPNHNARKCGVSLLVLHYTGMDSADAAIERLCDPDAAVSAHYVVCEDGRIVQLVDEGRRAWHAGLGVWAGEADVNSASVGIEIVNGGHDFGLPPFPEVQIEAVIALSRAILVRNSIAPSHVIGHSDMAPERKRDPGERFPWEQLAREGVGLFPEGVPEGEGRAFLMPGQEAGTVADLQGELHDIGYEIAMDCAYGPSTQAVVTAFQRRFRPWRIDGVIDLQTRWRINQVWSLVHTDLPGLNIPLLPPSS
jgi:N-acetylmuramoyl-L-alanine amidase